MDSLAAMSLDPETWQAHEAEALAAMAAATTPAELEDVRVRFLGRKSELAQALRGVRDRETGMLLNGIRRRLEEALDARRTELESLALAAALGERRLRRHGPRDAARARPAAPPDADHAARSRMSSSGWATRSATDDEVATVWQNFDALTTAEGTPRGRTSDTFYLDDDVLLRTHTSPDQIRLMLARKPPIYMILPGRCYRRDTPDATHSPTFLQVEALVVDRHITLADLRGTVLQFVRELFGQEREVRMRTSFFPFTEPSVEFDITCFICGG